MWLKFFIYGVLLEEFIKSLDYELSGIDFSFIVCVKKVIVVVEDFDYGEYYVREIVFELVLVVIFLVVELFLDIIFEDSFNVLELNIFEMIMFFMMNMNGSFSFLFEFFYWGLMFKFSIYDDDVSIFVIVFCISL